MTRLLKTILAAMLALALVPGIAAAQGGHGGHDAETTEMMESVEELRGLSGREFEIGYINRIIPHHEGAVEMAEMIVDRAPHPEVQQAAERIIADQQREIDELTTFLREEYGAELQRDERQMMSEDMMSMIEEASPEHAEQIFLLMMREHHQSAVIMGELVLQKAKSQTLLDQARGMIESQRAEQEEFARYLHEFYGIEAPEPTGDMMAAADYAMGGMPETGAGGMAGSVRENTPVAATISAGLLALTLGALALRRRLA